MFGLGRRPAEAQKPSALRFKVLRASETGLVRKDNQDNVFIDSMFNVYCVADGMGGGAEGAKASEIVCDSMRRAVAESGGGFVNRMEAVANSLDEANAKVYTYARERRYRQMGSTAAVLMFDGEESCRAAVCYVGDSRVYRIRRGLAVALTRDHSVGAELGRLAEPSRAEEFSMRSNPLSHILTRAIGTEASVRPDWRKVDVMPGDRFVVCSDGVHDVITDSRLGFLVGYDLLEKAKERLCSEIVKNGAPDNYSFILVEVGGAQ